jgi:cobalt-zinc-cadmium efflux system membrane fusion protein
VTRRGYFGLLVFCVAAAASLGFGAAKFLEREDHAQHAEKTDQHPQEKDHGAEKHEGGFVELKEADAAAAGVQIVSVERGGGAEVLLPGRVSFAANAHATVGAPVSGAVAQVHVAAGSRVAAGAPLATLRSAEAARVRAGLDAAIAAAEAARMAEKREEDLYKAGVVARQDWETARATASKAEADLRASQAHIAALGRPDASGSTTIRSPIAGVVTRMSVAPGAFLTDGAEVAEVVDPARIELVFDAPPATLNLISVGVQVEARRPDGQLMTATVTAVAPGLAGERGNGTVRARPTGPPLPPGTVISGRLIGGASGTLVVPSDAVQTVDGKPSIFVAEPNGFRARPVIPGRAAFGKTEILRGLEGNERVAGTGAFLLKAQLAKGEVGHEH